MQTDQIAEALVKGTILEGPFFDEPVRVLLAKARGIVSEGMFAMSATLVCSSKTMTRGAQAP